LGHLVALHDVLVGHFLAGLLRHPLVADPGVGARLELVEGEVLMVDGGIQLHRHVDEPEADGSGPDGSRHERPPSARRARRNGVSEDPVVALWRFRDPGKGLVGAWTPTATIPGDPEV